MLSTLLRHMDWFLEHAVWPEGSPRPGLWWSMLDLKTGRRPAAGDRAAGVAKRCYRWIESPNGSNLYWDGPLVVACHALSARTGNPVYARAADRYIAAYLETAASPGGLIWWGNHYYVDASGTPVWFAGFEPKPVDEAHASARLHETRPLPVPWPLLHRVAPSTTLAALAAHRQHLAPEGGTGCFNRHADGLVDLAFIEAGGILALSFAYERQLGGPQREDLARQVLAYSWSKRDPRTGLVPVNPTHDRWDFHQTTSEIGLWAGGAFAVAALMNQPDLADMAADAVGNWASRAWCESERKFHGRLDVATGEANRGAKPTIYSPGTWCDPWDPLFPAHDYPLQMAEACLTAWEHTREPSHAMAVQRWATQLGQSLPARNGLGAYAEHYGRAIHFLWRAGKVLDRREWTALADRVADEALGVLSCGPGLRSHPWEDRVEAVDGMGWLILAALCLESNTDHDMAGLFW